MIFLNSVPLFYGHTIIKEILLRGWITEKDWTDFQQIGNMLLVLDLYPKREGNIFKKKLLRKQTFKDSTNFGQIHETLFRKNFLKAHSRKLIHPEAFHYTLQTQAS